MMAFGMHSNLFFLLLEVFRMPSHALFFILGVVLGPLDLNLETRFGEVLAPTGHVGSPSSHGAPPGTYCVTFWNPFLS